MSKGKQVNLVTDYIKANDEKIKKLFQPQYCLSFKSKSLIRMAIFE